MHTLNSLSVTLVMLNNTFHHYNSISMIENEGKHNSKPLANTVANAENVNTVHLLSLCHSQMLINVFDKLGCKINERFTFLIFHITSSTDQVHIHILQYFTRPILGLLHRPYAELSLSTLIAYQ